MAGIGRRIGLQGMHKKMHAIESVENNRRPAEQAFVRVEIKVVT
jgi:hypothetical protein